ncbi:hypothetical protein NBRC110019_01790 [Neptunitalea chrysea]|uniref:Fibronectin type-III domain-containing protein n=1 Tax=Neptunitalea chrysea TaxID=1647581 RepID=A0A9W6ET49_9FLAO|nr:choice-of-anchor J domain-containing protein [Neptunitalea chrysea]GLB51140.1 hypothetical protein NBRC110019_01790 [Neptunitalea chrysea]
MKKITTILLSIFTTLTASAQFSEDFSGGALPAGWVTFLGSNGLGTNYDWGYSTSEYMYCIFDSDVSTCQDWLVTPQITVSSGNDALSFETTTYAALDYGYSLKIMVSTTSQTNISDYTTVTTYTESDLTVQSFSTKIVDLSAYSGQSIYIAFVAEGNATTAGSDAVYIDDVTMVASASSAPSVVTNPYPSDGATAVPLTLATDGTYSQVTFTWDAPTTGEAPLYYELNLGTSATDLTALNVTTTGTTYNIYGFSDYTTYYWEIIPVNSAGAATGTSVWSFTTGTEALSIDTIEDTTFSVYPNPVSDVLNISGNETLVKAEVYNQLGQLVLTSEKSDLSGNTIDIAQLNTGIYIVKLFGENNSQSITIAKE